MAADEECYWGPKRVKCDACRGLGWQPASGGSSPSASNHAVDPNDLSSIAIGACPAEPAGQWATRCHICMGHGDVSLHTVAKLIDEDPGLLYRLSEQRVRPKTAMRIFPKLAALCLGEVGGLVDA